MADSTEFTFCQASLLGLDGELEAAKAIPDMKKMFLEDNPSSGASSENNKKADYTPRGSATLQEQSGASSSNDSIKVVLANDDQTNTTPSRLVNQAEDLDHLSQEQKPTVKKPLVRAKVPFEKGYSQMDWLKLTRTDPDLAGLKGNTNRRLISMDEVKQHKIGGSIWTVLKGRVYNISPYMKFHPGGEDMLKKAAGKDCTSLFSILNDQDKYHAWVNSDFLLDKCLVGILDPN